MSTPKVKAVLRWTCEVDNKAKLGDQCWCLPADAESYDAMVEQMANAHYRHYTNQPKALGYTGTCYTVAEKMLADVLAILSTYTLTISLIT